MATTSEFKFNCPRCGQHILAEAAWVGREINCPSCKKSITIPPPPTAPKQQAPVPGTTASLEPKPRADGARVEARAGGAGTVTPPSTPAVTPKEAPAAKVTAPAPEPKPAAPATVPKPPEQPRVAVLSPGVKAEMVRAVRRRITDEAAWLPSRVKGAPAYAAKMKNGEPVLVDVHSPEATRFSLVGAFLLEMHARQVVQTAVGRKRFLDEEIPDAVREVLMECMSDEEREHAEEHLAGRDPQAISHEQCLAVLDVLEERCLRRGEQLQIERAKRKLGSARLPELVKKLEKQVPLSPEDVATALYHEVMELRRRLERVEARLLRGKQGGLDQS